MASNNNIFEVLQQVAENPSSSEKLFGILEENGYKGTLEDAGREIQQAEQVILKNLTSDDLKNIAGGKSLMNEKLKQIIAVGGASLMAGSAIVPAQAKTNPKQAQKENKIIKHVKENPIHSVATGILAGTTVGLTVLSTILSFKLNTKPKDQTIKALDEAKLKQFLENIPAGHDILDLLHLNLPDDSANAVIQLKAYKDQNKENAGTGEAAENTYIDVTAGTDEDGMCAKGRIMEGLDGKTIKLSTLATYLAFKAGGDKKLTAKTDEKSKTELFKTLENDEDLTTYQRINLNEDGKILAEIIEDHIFTALNQKKEKDVADVIDETNKKVDDESLTDNTEKSSDNTSKSHEEESEKSEETNEILDRLLELDYTDQTSTNALQIKFYTSGTKETAATKATTEAPEAYVTLTKGTADDAPNTLDALEGKVGTLVQMVYHLVRLCDTDNKLTTEGATLPELSQNPIAGYEDNMFNAKGQQYTQGLIEKITVAYDAGKVQTETNV